MLKPLTCDTRAIDTSMTWLSTAGAMGSLVDVMLSPFQLCVALQDTLLVGCGMIKFNCYLDLC